MKEISLNYKGMSRECLLLWTEVNWCVLSFLRLGIYSIWHPPTKYEPKTKRRLVDTVCGRTGLLRGRAVGHLRVFMWKLEFLYQACLFDLLDSNSSSWQPLLRFWDELIFIFTMEASLYIYLDPHYIKLHPKAPLYKCRNRNN